MIKEKALKNGIQLTTKIDTIPPKILADERKFKQILYNLLSNAVKFTEPGGEISIEASMTHCPSNSTISENDFDKSQIIKHDHGASESDVQDLAECILISVTDTGIGLAREDQERIFQPFEQADGSASRRYQGTGLGLSLTQKLVELHGGTIWVNSEGENCGSTFSFVIPIDAIYRPMGETIGAEYEQPLA